MTQPILTNSHLRILNKEREKHRVNQCLTKLKPSKSLQNLPLIPRNLKKLAKRFLGPLNNSPSLVVLRHPQRNPLLRELRMTRR